jgi:hypothetical protein
VATALLLATWPPPLPPDEHEPSGLAVLQSYSLTVCGAVRAVCSNAPVMLLQINTLYCVVELSFDVTAYTLAVDDDNVSAPEIATTS